MGIEDEFEQHNNQKSWNPFFDQLQQASFGKHESSSKDARRSKFRNRNRYADVSPYDYSRVRLVRNNIDYINASLVDVPDADRAYILTQGPLKDTSGHFWLMVWEQNSRAVVMLNRVIEKQQVKCHQYFPAGQDNEGDDEMVFNDVGLKVTYITERHTNYHFTTRVLQLTDVQSNESREVLQFHYTAWPDHGVPESPTAFLEFLFTIRDENVFNNPETPPVIHCSAGIGRSGTICLVDTCLVLAGKNGGSLNDVNVVEVLLHMRRFRMGLIQTADQLRFSYLAIIEGAKRLFQDNNTDVMSNKNGKVHDDEYDVLESFDSVIDSFDDVDSSTEPMPVSPAQAQLEGLFIRPDQNPGKSKSVPESNPIEAERAYSNVKSEERTIPVTNDTSPRQRPTAAKKIDETAEDAERRRQLHEERVRNTAEQIARIKQRMRESEQQKERQQSYRPYAIAAVSVAVAVIGYLAYQFVS